MVKVEFSIRTHSPAFISRMLLSRYGPVIIMSGMGPAFGALIEPSLLVQFVFSVAGEIAGRMRIKTIMQIEISEADEFPPISRGIDMGMAKVVFMNDGKVVLPTGFEPVSSAVSELLKKSPRKAGMIGRYTTGALKEFHVGYMILSSSTTTDDIMAIATTSHGSIFGALSSSESKYLTSPAAD